MFIGWFETPSTSPSPKEHEKHLGFASQPYPLPFHTINAPTLLLYLETGWAMLKPGGWVWRYSNKISIEELNELLTQKAYLWIHRKRKAIAGFL